MVRIAAVLMASCVVAAGAVRAEVVDSQPGGFTVSETRVIAAPPAMSNFISFSCAVGFSHMPPESNVTALPISASRGPPAPGPS